MHRVAVILPFAEFLTDIGAPVESSFRRHHLSIDALEDPDNYLPSNFFWKFLTDMSRSQGIEDLGFLVGKQFGVNCADPKMNVLLNQAATLYQGLRQGSELTNRTITNCRLGLQRLPGSRYTQFFHRPSCRTDNPAVGQIGWFGVLALCGMVREFTGPQWQPPEIGLMSNQSPGERVGEYFPDSPIKLAQPFFYISVENELLRLPPFTENDVAKESKSVDYRTIQQSFVESLEQLLPSYRRSKNLSIDLVAEFCNTSKRSLQRKLSENGTSYQELLDRLLLNTATAKLLNSDMSVTDIASRLGYSDVSHFIRAFRRVTGVTPQFYRREAMKGHAARH